jgi:antitoxin (DNA-binding transcriptional repressor) of toxin-antitoxin stability system
MNTVDISQLRDDTSSVISAAQQSDVFVTEGGRIVAVLSKPNTPLHFEEYWRERERKLSGIIMDPNWDSAIGISEDRDGR